jgi:hypothetical protein
MDTEGRIEDYREWIGRIDSRLEDLIRYYEACQNYEMCALLLEYQTALSKRLRDDYIPNMPDSSE